MPRISPRSIRSALLLSAPLALVLAAWWLPAVDPNAGSVVSEGRQGMIARARLALAYEGLDVSDWRPLVRVRQHQALARYYRWQEEEGTAAVETARRLISPVVVQVIFKDAESGREAAAELDPAGRPLGFELDRKVPRRSYGKPPEALAREHLVERFGAGGDALWNLQEDVAVPNSVRPLLSAGLDLSARAQEATSGTGTTFYWQRSVEGLPHLAVVIFQRVDGGRVLEERRWARLDSQLDDRRFGSGRLPEPFIALCALFFVALLGTSLVWGLWRYWLRLQESEVSHPRTLGLGLMVALVNAVALFYGVRSGAGELDLGAVDVVSNPLLLLLVALMVGMILMPIGLLLGLVWSGCEGDVRELYPRRLISLDAFLAGRWLSRPPAQALLTGAACACWAVFLRVLLLLPWSADAAAGPALVAGHFLRDHPWQMTLAKGLLVLVPYLPLGFLAPISLIRRWPRLRPWGLASIILALVLQCWLMSSFDGFHSLSAGWMVGLAWAVVFLVAVVVFDLLTAGFAFIFTPVLLEMLFYWHQGVPELRDSAVTASVISGLVLIAAAIIARRGYDVSAEEVRPDYARNMAERMALSAELSAARQARNQLLPREVPELPGVLLEVATAPTQRTEGDYHDFFVGAEGKLGVVLANFGSQGLGAALGVTLAKGFLLSYSRRDLRPRRVVDALGQRLADLVTGPLETNPSQAGPPQGDSAQSAPESAALVYGILDSHSWVLRLALGRPAPLVLAWIDGARQPRRLWQPSLRGEELELPLAAGAGVAMLTFRKMPEGKVWDKLQKALGEGTPTSAKGLLEDLRKRGLEPGTVLLLARSAADAQAGSQGLDGPSDVGSDAERASLEEAS
ncbi:MAG: hypothetical protein SX243_17425 [Acidobacteriota bacterium]|nr:hypothetical protein [Acidobacteriota bacterium]